MGGMGHDGGDAFRESHFESLPESNAFEMITDGGYPERLTQVDASILQDDVAQPPPH